MIGLVIFLLVIGSCVWVHHDARGLTDRVAESEPRARLAPGPWVVGCVFLWILFFPAYLVRRTVFKRAHNLA